MHPTATPTKETTIDNDRDQKTRSAEGLKEPIRYRGRDSNALPKLRIIPAYKIFANADVEKNWRRRRILFSDGYAPSV